MALSGAGFNAVTASYPQSIPQNIWINEWVYAYSGEGSTEGTDVPSVSEGSAGRACIKEWRVPSHRKIVFLGTAAVRSCGAGARRLRELTIRGREVHSSPYRTPHSWRDRMSPCCVYGCMASTGVLQDKTTGAFYCAKHSAKQTKKVAHTSPSVKPK